MVFTSVLYYVFLLYALNLGESETLKKDLNLDEKIARTLLGRKRHVNQVPSNHVKRSRVAPVNSYSEKVDQLFNNLFSSNLSCLNIAKQKTAGKFENNADIQKAVQLVNIYTQDCMEYAGASVGKPLYATLNENLRSRNPQLIWSEMGTLLSEGLVLLGPQDFPNLYRGCHCQAVQIGTPFTFRQFASTTTDPNIALQFISPNSGKSFIHIIKAKGNNIQPYSHFPSENEILLDPNVKLDVVQVETDINRIREEIKKISPNADIKDDNSVAKFVVLDGSRKTKKPKGGFWSSCICGKS